MINGASQWLISGLSYKTNHHGDILWGYWMGYHETYSDIYDQQDDRWPQLTAENMIPMMISPSNLGVPFILRQNQMVGK